jgi:hypothetical protein
MRDVGRKAGRRTRRCRAPCSDGAQGNAGGFDGWARHAPARRVRAQSTASNVLGSATLRSPCRRQRPGAPLTSGLSDGYRDGASCTCCTQDLYLHAPPAASSAAGMAHRGMSPDFVGLPIAPSAAAPAPPDREPTNVAVGKTGPSITWPNASASRGCAAASQPRGRSASARTACSPPCRRRPGVHWDMGRVRRIAPTRPTPRGRVV